MDKGRTADFLILKIKRASFFCLGLIFFLFPGQNYFLLLQKNFKPSIVRSVNMELFPAPLPINFTGQSPPKLTARSALVMDKNSSVIMYAKNENSLLLPASTVKIMTALVALDNYRPDDVLIVGEIDVPGQSMKLEKGEKITVKNLLYGLLIASANDAAVVLAQNYPGGEKGFVAAMNQKAAAFNLTNTYFVNPTGLDSDKEERLLTNFSYTTALDLARLTILALKEPLIAQIVTTQKIDVTDVSGKIIHQLFNINQLLGKTPGVKGVKTGWTEEAGECLIAYIERNNQEIITVVLGSRDRFGETAKLIEWAFSNHQWISILPPI